MSIPQRREYEGLNIDIEQLSRESYCGKVLYTLAVAANFLSDKNYSITPSKNLEREYKTKPYSTREEVFIHLMGWEDCKLHYNKEGHSIPKDNEDSYQNQYKELLKKLENKRFQEDIKKAQTSKKEREDAYQEGWKSRIEELNNMVVINPE